MLPDFLRKFLDSIFDLSSGVILVFSMISFIDQCDDYVISILSGSHSTHYAACCLNDAAFTNCR